MWPLTRLFNRSLKDDLNGVKTIHVNGHKFKIRKINPLLDFPSDKIPQIFTDLQTKRKIEPPTELTDVRLKRFMEDMKSMVKAGVVDPRLSPEVLTVDDIFRWGDTGAKLYLEILAHSLNQFRGIKGVFFSIGIRRSLFTLWQKNLAELQLRFSIPTAGIQ